MLGALLHNELTRRSRRGPCRSCGPQRSAAKNFVKYNACSLIVDPTGTGVRINCVSPGQIDVGVDLKDIDLRGMTSQLPPAQSKEVRRLQSSGTKETEQNLWLQLLHFAPSLLSPSIFPFTLTRLDVKCF